MADTITKAPDVGPFWVPLSSSGTYVYADSFVAPTTGTVSSLGNWLLDLDGANTQEVIFDVVGTAGGAPDMSNIIATTGVLDLSLTTTLDFYSASTSSSGTLTAGQTYFLAAHVSGVWIAATASRWGDAPGISGGIVDAAVLLTMARSGIPTIPPGYLRRPGSHA